MKLVWVLLAALAGFTFFLMSTPRSPLAKQSPNDPTDCTVQRIMLEDGTTLTSEVAATPSAQQKGLSGRSELAPRTGMIFLFSNRDIHPFWMKNTLIPLDILWLDDTPKNARIKQVVEIVSLPAESSGIVPTYTPTHPATAVLELRQHEAESLGLKLGSKLELQPCDT